MSQPPPVQLFDSDLACTQAQQRELTVDSYSLVGLMELYWPTVNGAPLSPVELVHFIQDQGLHWPCFCSRIEHRPVSSSLILEGESGFVYCHYAQARCSFFSAALTGFAIPLNETRRTASLFHEYPSSVVSFTPYTTSLLSAFILDRARVFRLFGPQQLTGYLGDFHPDIRQLCKHLLFTTDLNGRPGPRHCIQLPNTHVEAGTQTPQYHSTFSSLCPLSTIVYPTVVETAALISLFDGQPLNNADVLQLFKRCGRCRKIFLPRFLSAHLASCDTYVYEGA
ncbi:hypothetical protein DFH08DRAFT_818375 [Mycena albidolilacea]|uniref:Uncharacterized protein n=1 Tax=Mycena albidolilacea TaxID=1033008 RepID=A0AAD7EG59_9AGAR|nr:hypothetical protein DFH08DRAFT_818375 [Mycena albidolilacea]